MRTAQKIMYAARLAVLIGLFVLLTIGSTYAVAQSTSHLDSRLDRLEARIDGMNIEHRITRIEETQNLSLKFEGVIMAALGTLVFERFKRIFDGRQKETA